MRAYSSGRSASKTAEILISSERIGVSRLPGRLQRPGFPLAVVTPPPPRPPGAQLEEPSPPAQTATPGDASQAARPRLLGTSARVLSPQCELPGGGPFVPDGERHQGSGPAASLPRKPSAIAASASPRMSWCQECSALCGKSHTSTARKALGDTAPRCEKKVAPGGRSLHVRKRASHGGPSGRAVRGESTTR